MTDSGYQQPYAYPPPQRQTNGLAIASLVVGIASFFICSLAGAVAIYLGNRAKAQIAQTGEEGEGLARAGVILGWIALALTVLGIIVAGVVIAIAVATNNS
ncbi:MAG TPA: DUF4190 domain-containing protein [Micromonosporaceae bacterium]